MTRLILLIFILMLTAQAKAYSQDEIDAAKSIALVYLESIRTLDARGMLATFHPDIRKHWRRQEISIEQFEAGIEPLAKFVPEHPQFRILDPGRENQLELEVKNWNASEFEKLNFHHIIMLKDQGRWWVYRN